MKTKKVIKDTLACIILVAIGIPLFLAIALATSVIGWPIFGICYLIDEISGSAAGERISEYVEEIIFAFYGFASLWLFLPLETLNSNC